MQRRKKLIFWRIERRLKQSDICDALDITPAHYSNLERGISNPSYDLLMNFKKVFKVRNVLDLFEKEEEEFNYVDKNTTSDIGEE